MFMREWLEARVAREAKAWRARRLTKATPEVLAQDRVDEYNELSWLALSRSTMDQE